MGPADGPRGGVWDDVVAGKPVGGWSNYMYEGIRYTAYFHFNNAGPGSLEVTYDGGGIGFRGSIRDTVITGGEFPDNKRVP